MDEIEKKKADRFRFLKRLYEVSEGNQFAFFDEKEIGRDIGLDLERVDIITQYLAGERLIEFRGGGTISITHWGVVQIEEALSKPEQATQYFPAVMNIISVHSMVNSPVS